MGVKLKMSDGVMRRDEEREARERLRLEVEGLEVDEKTAGWIIALGSVERAWQESELPHWMFSVLARRVDPTALTNRVEEIVLDGIDSLDLPEQVTEGLHAMVERTRATALIPVGVDQILRLEREVGEARTLAQAGYAPNDAVLAKIRVLTLMKAIHELGQARQTVDEIRAWWRGMTREDRGQVDHRSALLSHHAARARLATELQLAVGGPENAAGTVAVGPISTEQKVARNERKRAVRLRVVEMLRSTWPTCPPPLELPQIPVVHGPNVFGPMSRALTPPSERRESRR